MFYRSSLESRARELRHQEIGRLCRAFASWLTDALRSRHERMLRRRPAYRGLRSVNATPA